jgi:uncharacterized membrane protein
MTMWLAAPGSVLIGDRGWLWPAAAAAALLFLLVAAAYFRAVWPTRLRVVAGLLKIVGLALLVSCLVEPLWSGTRIKPGENLFLVLVDTSASLQVNDGRGQTRAARLQRALADERAAWQVRLAQDFDVRRYTFDARLAAVESFAGLTSDGSASALQYAMATLSDRFRDRPVAGVMLFTDGNATDWSAAAMEGWHGLAPIYPILVPGDGAGQDVAIENLSVTQTSFEDAPVTVQADVRTLGDVPSVLVGQLVADDGRVVQELRETRAADALLTPFRFQVRPDAPQLSFYQVRVAEADAVAQFDDPAETPEATVLNNARLAVVDRGGGPYRVLYVSGRPNWEYKFLSRAVAEDTQLDLVAMIRIARKEARFDFRGNKNPDNNQLFQGFKEGRDSDTESYDQPVIVRINPKDETELRDGFPKTKEELYGFHALILDDVEAAFFTHDQLSLIERFVSERGGGLLMLGGPDTFRHGGYSRTAVADLLPVYLDRTEGQPAPTEFRLNLTRDGWLQPWVRLRSTEPDEERRLAEMSGFRTLTRARDVKPAARTLATVRSESGESLPALVAQQYGDGRAAAVLIGDLWRWSLRREEGADDDLAKAWRQTVRWLVADVPERVQASTEETQAGAATALQIKVRLRDKEYQPLDNANVKVTIHPPDGTPLALDADASLAEPGLFEVTYVPRDTGGYRAEAVALDETGTEVGRDEVGWTSDPAADEFRTISINRALLDEMAVKSGGEVVPLGDLASFVESLPSRHAPVTEAWTSPLWHAPWVLLLAIGCLAGEWGLRRMRGMP